MRCCGVLWRLLSWEVCSGECGEHVRSFWGGMGWGGVEGGFGRAFELLRNLAFINDIPDSADKHWHFDHRPLAAASEKKRHFIILQHGMPMNVCLSRVGIARLKFNTESGLGKRQAT